MKMKSTVLLLAALIGFSACGNRPEPQRGDTQVTRTPSGAPAPAVWIATSDFQTSGWLARKSPAARA